MARPILGFGRGQGPYLKSFALSETLIFGFGIFCEVELVERAGSFGWKVAFTEI